MKGRRVQQAGVHLTAEGAVEAAQLTLFCCTGDDAQGENGAVKERRVQQSGVHLTSESPPDILLFCR